MFLFDADRVNVVGEFGGIGMALKGHLWNEDRNWGYGDLKGKEEATEQYVKYANRLKELSVLGLCGAVYTQTTDVESEINGLMTYDRKIVKMDAEHCGRLTGRFVIAWTIHFRNKGNKL